MVEYLVDCDLGWYVHLIVTFCLPNYLIYCHRVVD